MEYTDNGQQIGQETGTWGEKLQEGIEQPVYLQKIPEKKEYNFRSLKRCFRIIGLAYLVYLLVSTASQVVVSLIFQMPESRIGWNLWMMVCMLSMYPLATLFLYLILRRLPKARQTWKEPMKVGRYIGIFVICMGSMYLGNIIGQMFTAVIKFITGLPMENDIGVLISEMQPWLILLIVVIVGPIMEEFIFRKLLLDRIAGYGQATSMLISGLIFGIAHGNFYQFFYAFILGAIFAQVYLRTGNILHTIGLHMMINFCGSFVSIYYLELVESWGSAGLLLVFGQVMVMFGYMIAGVILLIYYRREIFLYEPKKNISAGKWFMAVMFNIGMILYLIVGAAFFVLNF